MFAGIPLYLLWAMLWELFTWGALIIASFSNKVFLKVKSLKKKMPDRCSTAQYQGNFVPIELLG